MAKISKFQHFTYPIDIIYDSILNKCILSGINKITCPDKYYINITFNNGVVAYLWNGNKYYAWLSEGSIGEYKFANSRPKRKTMQKLLDLIENYYIESIN